MSTATLERPTPPRSRKPARNRLPPAVPCEVLRCPQHAGRFTRRKKDWLYCLNGSRRKYLAYIRPLLAQVVNPWTLPASAPQCALTAYPDELVGLLPAGGATGPTGRRQRG